MNLSREVENRHRRSMAPCFPHWGWFVLVLLCGILAGPTKAERSFAKALPFGDEAPACSLSTDSLFFGQIEVGDSSALAFSVFNVGSDTLTGDLSFDCPNFVLLSDSAFAIAGGDSTSVVFQFAPTAEEAVSCSLDFGYDFCSVLWAFGEGVIAPECFIEAIPAHFGIVDVGDVAGAQILVTNVGGGVLSDTLAIDCDGFALVETDGFYELASGDTILFAAEFRPTEARDYSCVAQSSDCEVELSGRGRPVPVCYLDASSLDFGVVPIGEFSDLEFTITNQGGGSLSGNVTEVCADFQVLGETSYLLGSEESQVITVRFEPTSEAAQSCTIDLGSSYCSTVDASGSGVRYPICNIDDTSLYFGTVEVGQTETQEFTIENLGGGQLVGEVSLSCPFFQLDGDSYYDLGAEEAQIFVVRYAPTENGEHSCEISTGDGCESVAAAGIGFLPAVCEVTPTVLTLGDVEVGEAKLATITVRNSGGDELRGELYVDCLEVIFVGTNLFVLAEGESQDIIVRFSSAVAGEFACEITSSLEGCDAVILTATSVDAPVCVVSPLLLDFGTVELGSSAEANVRVANSGGGILEGELSLDCSAFSLLDGDLTYALAAGEEALFAVAYSPTEEGLDSCTLAAGGACADIQLRGVGEEPLGPICEVSTDQIVFEPTQIGEVVSETFLVRNIGEGEVVGAVVSDCSEVVVVGEFTFALLSGEFQEFEVQFRPLLEEGTECVISIGELCSSIEVSGQGIDIRQCKVGPSFLAFGDVEIGTQIEQPFLLENIGSVEISGAAHVVGGCADLFLVGPTGYALQPGETQSFIVRFEPTGAGPRACSVAVGDGSCAEVVLSGNGIVPPVCSVSALSLDFGTVQVGDVVEREFAVENSGGGTLFGEVQLDCPDWSLVGASDYALIAGDSQTFRVRYVAVEEGDSFCTIDMGSDRCSSIVASAITVPIPAPTCSFSPQLLDVGSTRIGNPIRSTLSLSNSGNAVLRGRLIVNCDQFQIVADTEIVLEPGEQTDVEVLFAPTSLGPIECRLEVDGACTGAGVTLRGRGELAVPPLCQLSPGELDFSSVPIGAEVERSVVIRNEGGGLLEGAFAIDCPGFEIVGAPEYSLGPNESHTLLVRFRPFGPGEESCQLEITSPGCAPIPIRGEGISSEEAECLLTPASLDFGLVPLGERRERELLVENKGAGVLVGDLESDSPALEILGDSAFAIGAGEFRRFVVRYEPTSLGTFVSMVRGAPDCEVVTVTAQGVLDQDPVCSLSTDDLEFGWVPVGEVVSRSLQVTNEGGGRLEGRVSLVCDEFSVIGADGYSLEAGESKLFDIEFSAGKTFGSSSCRVRAGNCEVLLRARVVSPTLDVTMSSGTFRSFGFGLDVSNSRGVLAGLGELGVDYDLWHWVESVPGSEFGSAYRRWSALSNPTSDGLVLGDGYWLQSMRDQTLSWSGAPVVQTPVRYPLASGWTQFSSPFQVPVQVSQIQVASAGSTQPLLSLQNREAEYAVWEWDGATYQVAETLLPLASYWVRTRGKDVAVALLMDDRADEISDLPQPNWALTVTAQQSNISGDLSADLDVVVGQAVVTELSLLAPPSPPFSAAAMWVEADVTLDSDSDSDSESQTFDSYRKLFLSEGDRAIFDISCSGLDPDSPVRLSFEAWGLPVEAGLVLTDWNRRETRAFDSSETLRLDPTGTELQIRIVVSLEGGDTIPPESIPPDIALTTFPIAQPNPFFAETDLRFVLEKPGDLIVEIFDAQGRSIRALKGASLPAGEVRLSWDGNDANGHRVQSGVYLARFAADRKIRTLRIVRIG